MIILLIGAVASFVFAGLGLPPLLTIVNPDGQDYYFFYTGFTNSYSDNFIRASAIYDEPGAFSMYICFVAALRHLLDRDRKRTWLMLMLGFITFSLAHLIYVFCHFLAEQSSKTRILTWLSLLALLLFATVTSISPDSDIVFLSRLALTEDTNLFAGDNRSFQLFNAFSQLSENRSGIFFGLDNTCVFSQSICQAKFGFLGENPLSPLAFGGLLSEAPYYVTVLMFLLSPFLTRKHIVIFGIGLLFLQRPYVMGFSYSLIAVTLLKLMWHSGRQRSQAQKIALAPRGARRPPTEPSPRHGPLQPLAIPQTHSHADRDL
jgi:threonine/homoserine/homoserine lactone efflux protein